MFTCKTILNCLKDTEFVLLAAFKRIQHIF